MTVKGSADLQQPRTDNSGHREKVGTELVWSRFILFILVIVPGSMDCAESLFFWFWLRTPKPMLLDGDWFGVDLFLC